MKTVLMVKPTLEALLSALSRSANLEQNRPPQHTPLGRTKIEQIWRCSLGVVYVEEERSQDSPAQGSFCPTILPPAFGFEIQQGHRVGCCLFFFSGRHFQVGSKGNKK